jgi:hypothetical protein
MNFSPYDTFPSSDVPEIVNQQNSWNSLVITTYLLYLECNVGMSAVNICILLPPTMMLARKLPYFNTRTLTLNLANLELGEGFRDLPLILFQSSFYLYNILLKILIL